MLPHIKQSVRPDINHNQLHRYGFLVSPVIIRLTESLKICLLYIFSSILPHVMRRYTTTFFSWPMRNALSTACESVAGFQLGSSAITVILQHGRNSSIFRFKINRRSFKMSQEPVANSEGTSDTSIAALYFFQIHDRVFRPDGWWRTISANRKVSDAVSKQSMKSVENMETERNKAKSYR